VVPNPRVVFFDFFETLATDPLVARTRSQVWADACAECGIARAEPRIAEALASTDRRLGERIYDYVGRTPEFWRLYQEATFETLGIRDHREELRVRLNRRFSDPSTIELYPESRRVLEALRGRGYRLGMISDATDFLLVVLKHLRIDGLFDTVTYSQQAGAWKPDPRIFALALTRAGCAAEQAVHVGDSWEADYLGATNAGLSAVWLNRSGAAPPTNCVSVSTLSGVPSLLSR
jgi:2-haloalkanoic acid dehalogenase type II